MSTITYVTAFYNIGRVTYNADQNFNNYFAWINQLLQLPINIYFFTTEALHERLKYTPRHNLHFHITNKIPYFDRLDDIRASWDNFRTNNPAKDTPEFSAIMHAKFVWLKKAIKVDPFKSSHFAWLDAGITKVATNPELLPTLVPPEKIKCLLIQYTSMEEVKNVAFVDSCKYKIAGGFFLGPKGLMKVFCLSLIALAEYHLYTRRFGLEQEFITIIYKLYPEIFETFYGDFRDLFLNYNCCQRNLYLLELIFNDAVRYHDREEAVKVAKFMLKSPTIDDNQRTNLLSYLTSN